MIMKILVVNSGSSSIKFQLIQMPDEKVIASGIIERIGQPDAIVKYRSGSFQMDEEEVIDNHSKGLKRITELLQDKDHGTIDGPADISAIGHRVVHGGNSFTATCFIDESVKQKISEYSIMAPLHNPHNLKGIELTETLFPNAFQIAVFDTAFHQSIPVHAHKYAIPNLFYEENELKVYGFHGTSHAFVHKQATDFLGGKINKLISVHLGNGCSITAVKDGKSVDTSLGFGPSNGLIMGTRSGDIDHSMIFFLANALNYSLDEIKRILDKESGMLGLTGYSDLREIESAAESGSAECELALGMNAYRIKKYIGAYAAAMNGVDVLIFTAGIGENSSKMRALVCEDMDFLGIALDRSKNENRSAEIRQIDSGSLAVRILVVPTNEELEIARQSYELVRARVQE